MAPPTPPAAASAATHPPPKRHAGAALLLLCAAALAACATVPHERPAQTLDFVDARGAASNVDALAGKVVVIDLCASWAAACNLNAKVLDEVAGDVEGKPVFVVTILIDDPALAKAALASYAEVLEVKHAVVLAGPHLRAGTSALGEASYVPRLIIVDKRGVIRVDDSGGVLNVEGLMAKIQPLL